MVRRLRSVALFLCVGLAIGTAGYYYFWRWRFVTTAPIDYNPLVDKHIIVRPRIQDHERRLYLDTGACFSFLFGEVWKGLLSEGGEVAASATIAAVTSLGRYYRREDYMPMDFRISKDIKEKHFDGLLGNSFFEAASPLSEYGPAEGVCITLDFVEKTLTIEFRPGRPTHKPPAGTISIPLRKDEGDGVYHTLLSVNGGAPLDFIVDTGASDVDLPMQMMRRLTGKNSPTTVPIILGVGKARIKAVGLSWAAPKTGVLGLSVLARYRVVLDYRDKMLYLEPSR